MKRFLAAAAVAGLLISTITSEGLWTDEAFSAFIASHRSFASCWSTLVTGDASDLQMALYYLYLHGWTQWFGQSEIAFRSANIPFILLFAGVLVWGAERVFQSRWVWIVAALAPASVAMSNDSRPYFDLIALSLTCITCLLAYLQSPTPRERKVLPSVALLALFLGATLHMLMLLLVPPLLVALTCFFLANRKTLPWRDWKWPLVTFSTPALALLLYFAWTFLRGTHYDYSRPDLMSMWSVFFRFAGLSGFAPNRRYEIPFHPYLFAMALSACALAAGFIALFIANSKSQNRLVFRALLCALATALAEVFVLSFALHQQIEFRHLSALLPILLLLIMAGLSGTPSRNGTAAAAVLIGITWLVGDIRWLNSGDYRREDFRAAVGKAIALQNENKAAMALVADPVAAAYYGLAVQGPKPCFPLTDACSDGFAKVPWSKIAPAEYATAWPASQIKTWLETKRRNSQPVILLISRGRHPIVKDSAWWPIVQAVPGARLYPLYGFYVFYCP